MGHKTQIKKNFLLQAENIYNDEEPEAQAAELEAQTS